MKIGIGLPATHPGITGSEILEWARQADAGPFSSLGIIDRLVYPNFEPMITLAAAAGATQRIGLMTTVLLGPLRSAGMLAKEAASLDALSGGRLTLGLGVGGRESDYAAAGTPYSERGKRVDEQLAVMKRVWAGEAMSDEIGEIGPAPVLPGGPPILIGGFSPAAMRRVGQWADGYMGTVVDPQTAGQLYGGALQAWQAAGREGKPRFVMGLYYALGPDAFNKGGDYLRHYYAFDPAMAPMIASAVLAEPSAIQAAIDAYAEVGVDEINFWPTIPDIDQLHRLADIVAAR